MPQSAESADDAGPRLDHVGIGVARIRDHLRLWEGVFGAGCHLGGDNPEVGYRAVQLALPGGGVIELMEPLTDSTFLTRFLQKRPGVHHVTMQVPSLGPVLTRAEQAGYRPISVRLDRKPMQFFLHPSETGCGLIQVIEGSVSPPPSARTTEGVLAGEGFRGNGIPSP